MEAHKKGHDKSRETIEKSKFEKIVVDKFGGRINESLGESPGRLTSAAEVSLEIGVEVDFFHKPLEVLVAMVENGFV